MTVGCLAYAVAGMDLNAVRSSFSQANYWSLPPMLLIIIVFYVLKAWRWALLLRPVKQLTPWQVTPALLIGFMANNLLPAHLGEFVRVFVLGNQFDIDKTPVLSTVVLERVFDILAILLLLGISLPFINGMPADLERMCQIFGAASLLGVCVLMIYMVFTQWFVKTTRAIFLKLPFLPEKLTNGIVGMLETGAVGLESVRNPKLLAAISISSVLQWMLNALLIYSALWAFGVGGSYSDCVLVMGVIVFAILLPSTPGYFGVIQACFKVVLGAGAGIFGASIYYHMCQYIPVTLTGLFFVNRLGLSLGALKAEATGGEEPSEFGPGTDPANPYDTQSDESQ